MNYEQAANEAFIQARIIYTGKDLNKQPIPGLEKRYKSTNKIVLPLNSPVATEEWLSVPDGIQTMERACLARVAKAGKHLEKQNENVVSDLIEDGVRLINTRAKAMNCSELALIAMAWANHFLGAPQPAPVALLLLQSPADHAFCAVGSSKGINKVRRKRVMDLADEIAVADDVWAVDPWLNICCNIQSYAVYAEAKLRRWQQKNKRLFWAGGEQGPGYYAPQGEYLTEFLDTTLSLGARS